MRIETREVFNGQVFSASATYYSDADHNAALGKGEKIVIQIVAENCSGTITFTITPQESNDNRNWKDRSAAISSWSPTTTTVDTTTGTDSGPYCAFVRLKIAVSGSTVNARIRILVCIRGEQGGA